MSEIAQTIQQLRAEGLNLRVIGGRLKVEPAYLITEALDEWLRDHAREVKDQLAKEQRPVALPRPNTTQVPDVFFDEIAPLLSERELRVLLYIIRRTYGFKKEEDSVSISQLARGIVTQEGKRLDHGTGMDRANVVRALQSLERRGYLIAVRAATPGRGNQVNRYRLALGG